MPDTLGPRILVVDDNRQLRRLFALYLESEGFAIGEADDGKTALEYCNRERCDLVLLDLRMPGLSGHEVPARLRADAPDLPVIVVRHRGRGRRHRRPARRRHRLPAEARGRPRDPAAYAVRRALERPICSRRTAATAST
ncbi:MAG: response regulator [bacterium]|nr:response regulator [bacterium]